MVNHQLPAVQRQELARQGQALRERCGAALTGQQGLRKQQRC